MSDLTPSELILNRNSSIYHLNLSPGELASTILLVGDPGRVPMVSKYFDRIEITRSKREFNTHTGWLGDTRLSVISTGIGTDNIDIVINEADALFNIDFEKRKRKENTKSLSFIRLGTSGALQPDIPVNSLVCSRYAAGFDTLMHFYPEAPNQNDDIARAFFDFMESFSESVIKPYFETASDSLFQQLSQNMMVGITLTCPGFYGPQGRSLRAGVRIIDMLERLRHFKKNGYRIINLEMETSGIFGLSRILNHRAASCNAILANRYTNEFSSNHKQAVEKLIQEVLALLVSK